MKIGLILLRLPKRVSSDAHPEKKPVACSQAVTPVPAVEEVEAVEPNAEGAGTGIVRRLPQWVSVSVFIFVVFRLVCVGNCIKAPFPGLNDDRARSSNP